MQSVAAAFEPAGLHLPDSLRGGHPGETGAVWIFRGVLAVTRDSGVRACVRSRSGTGPPSVRTCAWSHCSGPGRSAVGCSCLGAWRTISSVRCRRGPECARSSGRLPRSRTSSTITTSSRSITSTRCVLQNVRLRLLCVRCWRVAKPTNAHTATRLPPLAGVPRAAAAHLVCIGAQRVSSSGKGGAPHSGPRSASRQPQRQQVRSTATIRPIGTSSTRWARGLASRGASRCAPKCRAKRHQGPHLSAAQTPRQHEGVWRANGHDQARPSAAPAAAAGSAGVSVTPDRAGPACCWLPATLHMRQLTQAFQVVRTQEQVDVGPHRAAADGA